VLADPYKFVGCTLADPLEGNLYGRCKAKIMRRADGSVWIHFRLAGRGRCGRGHTALPPVTVERAVRWKAG
jgi:hypothetical protein